MPDMEMALCGAICIDPPRSLPRINGLVTSEDFTDERCANLFDAAIEAQSRGKTLDAVIIADAITALFPCKMEAQAFVRSCMEACPTLANVELHAKMVHKASRDRKIRNIIAAALYSELDGDELAASVISECQDFLKAEHSARSKTLAEALSSMYSNLSKQEDTRIDTGFPRLDSILKGLPAGSLTLIGARPSVGKSAFSEDLALTVARRGRPVLLFSMEMDAEELAERAAAREALVPLSSFIDHTLTKDQYAAAAKACSKMHSWPLHICDAPNITTTRIRSLARTIPDLALIIVDYIGLMQATKANDSRNLELGAISRDLKNLASELRIPIVALTQLNRLANDTQRPNLTNIRDSGELEQNASKVLFLWNECKEDKIVGVSVAKNRRGSVGDVFMRFDGDLMSYKEVDYVPQPKQEQTFPARKSCGY
jgi:replicative DNA helicase